MLSLPSGLLLLWVVVAGPVSSRGQAPPPQDLPALQQFEQRVATYVELHRQLEGPVPTLDVSPDLRDVHAAMAALRKAVRRARRNAKQGDVFAPPVVRALRTRIADCLTSEDWDAMLADQDERAAGPSRLKVNEAWPSGASFTFVPPHLLAALPPLAPELQYRIIGSSLVLWDHHADLIVDFFTAFDR